MNTIRIYKNPNEPASYETVYTDNVSDEFYRWFDRFQNVRIYHRSVSLENDVTPFNDITDKRLNSMKGEFIIVVYAGFWFIAYFLIAIVASFVAVKVLAPKPKMASLSNIGSSNNELSQRGNKERVFGRIPDIYGQVRCYPDLIADVITFFDHPNNLIGLNEDIEIEECLMCIGRGYYDILAKDIKDGDTACNVIDGNTVAVFEPGADINSTGHQLLIGNAFPEIVKFPKRCEQINGQSIPYIGQNNNLSTGDLTFYLDGRIRNNQGIDWTTRYSTGDTVQISGGRYEGAASDLWAIVHFIALDGDDVELLLNSNSSLGAVTNGKQILFPSTAYAYDASENFINVAGTYTVSGVTTETPIGDFMYSISLKLTNGNITNPNWSLAVEDGMVYIGNESNTFRVLDSNSMNLAGDYDILSVTSTYLTIDNPIGTNADWAKIDNWPDNNTSAVPWTISPIIQKLTGSDNWIGWFNVIHGQASHIYLNLTWPQGLLNGRSNGWTSLRLEWQALDENQQPDGPVYRTGDFGNPQDYSISLRSTGQFSDTWKVNMTFGFAPFCSNGFRFRVSKTSSGVEIGDVKLKDVFGVSFTESPLIYPNVSVVRTRTRATTGALSVKERKLNLIVTRKLYSYASGSQSALRYPTKNAADIICALALDDHIGRLQLSDIDTTNIYNTLGQVANYFGTNEATEFCYTFDDSSQSFEEMCEMVASHVYCQPYRFGNILRLNAELYPNYPVLLFNHRNVVPDSQKHTVMFGTEKNYDGIELAWKNPIDDSQAIMYMPYDRSATNPKKISFLGVRNFRQAYFHLHRNWNKLQYTHESVEFEALPESNLITKMGVFLYKDRWIDAFAEGEIISQSGLVIELSQPLVWTPGESYQIHLQMADGSIDIIGIDNCGDDNYHVILNTAPSMSLVTDDDRFHTLYAIYPIVLNHRRAKLYMVSEKTFQSKSTNVIKASNFDQRFYDNDKDYVNSII